MGHVIPDIRTIEERITSIAVRLRLFSNYCNIPLRSFSYRPQIVLRLLCC